MKSNGQLSGVLHVMLHMAEQRGPMTSEMLARMLNTNPVVVRRILAGLRDKGYVRSEKGHGGGWILACSLGDVTLRDIYTALGCPSVLAIGHWNESTGCLVEEAVNNALSQAFRDAEALLLDCLGQVTLATLSADLHTRLAARRGRRRDLDSVHPPKVGL
jgi:DNA-binding IscR family transcriptional regulator